MIPNKKYLLFYNSYVAKWENAIKIAENVLTYLLPIMPMWHIGQHENALITQNVFLRKKFSDAKCNNC